MAKNKSKITLRTILGDLLSGIDKHFNGQSLIIKGVSVKSNDLEARWQTYLAAVTDADTARAAWLGKVDVVNKLLPGIRSDIVGVHDYVRVMFGPANPALADFGMSPERGVATRTVAEKAAAIGKSLATSFVRHTLGPKQMAALHGSAPTASPSPVPAAPATPAVMKPGNQS